MYSSKVLFSITLPCLLGAANAQNLLSNGSLTGPTGEAITPSGWVSTALTPDTNAPGDVVHTTPGYQWQTVPTPSPNGGTFVSLYTGEAFAPAAGVSLTAGIPYTLSFEYATWGIFSGSLIFNNPSAITLSTLAGSFTTLTSPLRAAGAGWASFSTTFVPAATQVYRFQFANNATGSYAAIDGIAVSAVPEPTVVSLLTLGAFVCFTRARRVALRRHQASRFAN